MRRGGEVDVAQAALTASGDHQRLLRRDEIAEQSSGFVFEHARAGWDLEGQVIAGLAVLALPGPATTRRALEVVAWR